MSSDDMYCILCHGKGIIGRWDFTCPRCHGTGIEPTGHEEEEDTVEEEEGL